MTTYRTDRRSKLTCTIFILLLSWNASAANTSEPATRLTVPEGTPVQLLLANTVSSAHAHAGDPLDFVVVRDVLIDGLTVIPAGSVAHGSVTAVHHRRVLGIGGEVGFRLDSVRLANGESVALVAHQKVKGPSHFVRMALETVAVGLFYMPAAPIFLLNRGGDSTVLKSTEVTAHLAGNTSVVTATLPAARAKTSELAQMLEFLPPRVLTGEGRSADMVNLIFLGQSDELQATFERAGWVKTDKWRPVMAWHLFCRRTHDAQLPMARFYLFGRVQDYSYALPDPNAIVSRRHHLRIWKTKYTVDGNPVWAGAATHDVAIEIAKRGRVINHTIDPEVDAERDFIGVNLGDVRMVSARQYLQPADPVFYANTASGEAYYSDSRILLLDLHQANLAAVAPPRVTEPKQTSLPIQILTKASPATIAPSGASLRIEH